MPVLESTDHKIAPKSILRHRPIGDEVNSGRGNGRGDVITTPMTPRASRSYLADVGEEVVEWKRMPETGNHPSAEAGVQSTQERKVPAHSAKKRLRADQKVKRATFRAHPLLYLGAGMLAMVVLWGVGTALFGWITTVRNDIQYGRPRTYQVDAWVGHNEQAGVPSHFIVINLNRHIEIIELSGGDAAHTRIYTGPQLYNSGDELVPVTLRFVDVNGDHKPDMIVQFQATQVVFINDQGGFRPLLPTEQKQVEHVLQYPGQ